MVTMNEQRVLQAIWGMCGRLRNVQSILKILECAKNLAIFWYMLVCSTYIMWPKLFKVPAAVVSMLVGALTCALLHFMYDFKAAQINVQCKLVWKLMFYKFQLDN